MGGEGDWSDAARSQGVGRKWVSSWLWCVLLGTRLVHEASDAGGEGAEAVLGTRARGHTHLQQLPKGLGICEAPSPFLRTLCRQPFPRPSLRKRTREAIAVVLSKVIGHTVSHSFSRPEDNPTHHPEKAGIALAVGVLVASGHCWPGSWLLSHRTWILANSFFF